MSAAWGAQPLCLLWHSWILAGGWEQAPAAVSPRSPDASSVRCPDMTSVSSPEASAAPGSLQPQGPPPGLSPGPFLSPSVPSFPSWSSDLGTGIRAFRTVSDSGEKGKGSVCRGSSVHVVLCPWPQCSESHLISTHASLVST